MKLHSSRINGILIDCNVDDIGAAAQFWAEALGRRIVCFMGALARISEMDFRDACR